MGYLPYKVVLFMKKRVSSIFAFPCKVFICLLIFFWPLIIVPILFYFTFADDDTKAQMLWNWREFNPPNTFRKFLPKRANFALSSL